MAHWCAEICRSIKICQQVPVSSSQEKHDIWARVLGLRLTCVDLLADRSLCFKCLNQLVISSLVRNAGAASKPQVVAWLDKIVKPGLTNARKGGLPMQEQQV